MWKRRRAHVALGIAMGMLALCLPLVLQSTEALAAFGPPTISELSPKEGASGGGYKVIIKGTRFEEVSAVHWGTGSGSIPMKIITTGTPTKGQCKVKLTTEIECFAPPRGRGAIEVTVTNPLRNRGIPIHDRARVLQERSRDVASGSKVPIFGEGVIDFETPEVELEPGVKSREVEIECINLMFGSIVNEGTIPKLQSQVLEWWAMGHVPTAEHSETSALCRFTYLGGPGGEAWVTAERPLNIVEQEGEVCLIRSKRELSECPKKVGEPGAERAITSVIRSVGREPLTNPWNAEVIWHEGEAGTPPAHRDPHRNRQELRRNPGASRVHPAHDHLPGDRPAVPVRRQRGTDLAKRRRQRALALAAGIPGRKGWPSARVPDPPKRRSSPPATTKIIGAPGRELITIK